MPKGGYRPGAGRPKGSKDTVKRASPRKAATKLPTMAVPATITDGGSEKLPLDYMLAVMNDTGADDSRRDRMAIAAAPFCHPRKEPVGQGKREAAEEAARNTAAEGGKYAPAPPPPRLVIDNG